MARGRRVPGSTPLLASRVPGPRTPVAASHPSRLPSVAVPGPALRRLAIRTVSRLGDLRPCFSAGPAQSAERPRRRPAVAGPTGEVQLAGIPSMPPHQPFSASCSRVGRRTALPPHSVSIISAQVKQ